MICLVSPAPNERNEDFYAAMEEGRVPDYDILVTSPPYSRDHMQVRGSRSNASRSPSLPLKTPITVAIAEARRVLWRLVQAVGPPSPQLCPPQAVLAGAVPARGRSCLGRP